MSAKTQVVISSDLNGELHSVCVWDLVTASTQITYKSTGCVQRHCLDIAADQLLVSSIKESPIINVWSFERKDQLHLKIICPGKVTALKLTTDGKYCLVAIGTSLYIWQTSSGALLAILEKHYQKITCIAVSSESTYFVTAGEDGLALVWSLAACVGYDDTLISDTMTSEKEPIYKWSDHTNAVTDVYIGLGDVEGLCSTCSTDQTCRIYELNSGSLLTTIVFETPLWSVVMDSTQTVLYCGGHDNNIYETKLYAKSKASELEKQNKPQFIGHEGPVTCLSISMDGLALISGSDDNNIKIWHVNSKQCMKTITNKGPVSNVMVLPFPSALLTQKPPNLPFKSFKRTILSDIFRQSSDTEDEYCIEIRNEENLLNSLSFMNGIDIDNDLCDGTTNSYQNNLEEYSVSNENENLRKELNDLKDINSKLYSYAVDSIFKSLP
ncbi:WD repeat-containing protein 18-like [Oppia nitens]|uniref:WD repeat-containing protein 18-like n=1 Tax=Oppia nitens TaxID=1686743 RepID=UPI0023DAD9B6|nr:WD repeat-containing protein 18-like [Oppia nitens]